MVATTKTVTLLATKRPIEQQGLTDTHLFGSMNGLGFHTLCPVNVGMT